MKKSLLLISFVILSALNLNASHIIGGDFNLIWIEGNTFNAELKLFKEQGVGAPLDAASGVEVTIFYSDNNEIYDSFTMETRVDEIILLGDECYQPDLVIEQGTYNATIELPDHEDGYYLVWERCCRSDVVTNLLEPGEEGMVFVCTVADPALHNSTPIFDDYPTSGYFCVGLENQLNFNVTDADGDSLVYFFDYPLSGDSTANPTTTAGSATLLGYAGPKPHSPCLWAPGYDLDNIMGTTIPMSIDQNTGTITVLPEEQGLYVFAVYVAEFRNGVQIGSVRREIQFQTLLCSVDYPPVFTSPEANDTLYEVIAEHFFQLPIVVEDQNASDPIIIEAESDLFDINVGNSAWFETEPGNGTITSYFNWFTECVHISNEYSQVRLRTFSDGCSGSDTTEFTFYVKVIPDIDGDIVDNAANVFTPNHDSKNEYFSLDVSINPCFDTFQIYIFDRWGKKVFESQDPLFRWYGKDKDGIDDLNDGVYFYIIDATFKDYTYHKTSSITILR